MRLSPRIRHWRWRGSLAAMLLTPALAQAVVVHIYQQTVSSGITNLLSDTTLDTGGDYTTVPAPPLSGHIFTHWSTDADQMLDNRDVWGRARDATPFHLYEETTLTANYLPVSQDADEDGVADGHEIYWYGSLVESAMSDTDGDSLPFAEEIARGSNPLFPDAYLAGAVAPAFCAPLLYNPHSYAPYILRSEPDGVLFATSTNYAERGEAVVTTDYNPDASAFAYWTVDGVRQSDPWGRALGSAAFTGTVERIVQVVAHTEDEIFVRHALHYYGDASISSQSDTDGDGLTFAEEIARGSNPLFPDAYLAGAVAPAFCAPLLYNPHSYAPYILRSEPDGVLFATSTNYAERGEAVVTTDYNPDASNFAYWMIDGVRQSDPWGRALGSAVFTGTVSRIVQVVAHTVDDDFVRHALHYYDDASIAAQSDTDGDGLTFAEEIARGSNPLFPDTYLAGAVVTAANRPLEMNLQPYEQVRGAIVGNAYTELFTSPVAGNAAMSATFGNGAAIWPVVADLNGDGLFDIVVLSTTTTNVLLNVGGKGNPEFRDGGDAVSTSDVDLGTNSTAKLAALNLDVAPPADALSATYGDANQDGLDDLLVSDSAGRIWYYLGIRVAGTPNSQLSTFNFQLQHKVWGGSYAGFADGLRLAAVDWDDDGDLDCLAGTADGKLMLLRDPKVGRPTNLKAYAGVDNILLTWDPNAQSRIRGYRLYRSRPEQAGDSPAGSRIAQTQLPTYRDFPGEGGDFAYRVSSVSRFYRAGNSTPTESESMPTEAVTASIGGVRFFWNDVATKVGERVSVMLSIENSMNYNVGGLGETVAYDPEYLTPVKVAKTGLTENCTVTDTVVGDSPTGQWQVNLTGGTLPAGGGKFLEFVFEARKAGMTTVGGEHGATVAIAPAAAPAFYQLGDLDGDGAVDVDDLRLLAKLKNGNGRLPTADQLKAGDFNGNGKIDNADYQAMKKLLKDGGLQ